MPKRKKVELVSIKIRCPKLLSGDDEVDVPVSACHFSGGESSCETCGSHGKVEVSFHCPACGKKHEIELESW
jgi:hypothetical protein